MAPLPFSWSWPASPFRIAPPNGCFSPVNGPLALSVSSPAPPLAVWPSTTLRPSLPLPPNSVPEGPMPVVVVDVGRNTPSFPSPPSNRKPTEGGKLGNATLPPVNGKITLVPFRVSLPSLPFMITWVIPAAGHHTVLPSKLDVLGLVFVQPVPCALLSIVCLSVSCVTTYGPPGLAVS